MPTTKKNFSIVFAAVFTGLIVLSLLIGPVESLAVPASPDVLEYVQPDGSVVRVRAMGDEWNNWIETLDGYSIEKSPEGFWEYIDRYEGELPVLSGITADETPPLGLEKHITKPKDSIGRSPAEVMYYSLGRAPVGPFSGPVLFILAQFTNRTGTYSEASFGTFIANNISDYFDKASNSNVSLTPASETFGTINNGVIGWVDIGYAHPNTGGNIGTANQQLTRDAIIAADDYIDYSSFNTNADSYIDADELAIVVIAAGYEAAYDNGYYQPTLWGHRWCLGSDCPGSSFTPPTVDGVIVGAYNGGAGGYAQFGEIHQSRLIPVADTHQATMGIMVHELGHLIFGMPDLYDTDSTSEGIGAFGLMSSGSWGAASTDTYGGETPVLPCAWSRYDRGWVTAPVSGSGTVLIEAAGSASATASNSAYRVLTSLPNEYFMVENRQPLGYDKGLERWLGTSFGGLAIWHIDDNIISSRRAANTINNSECYPGGPSCFPNHYGVALVQADAMWDLEIGTDLPDDGNRGNATDLWYQVNQQTFCSDTTPNSLLWNSTVSGVNITNISAPGTTMQADFQTPVVLPPADPTNLTAAVVSHSKIDLSWDDNSFCEDRFDIERKRAVDPSYAFVASVTAESTYRDTGLSASTEYQYRVRAFNSAGSSNYSNEPLATTKSAPSSSSSAASSGGGGGGGGCFIATAAYGSYMADEVMVLREFRDRYLLTNSFGRTFIKAYYKYSPPVADVIRDSAALRAVTRAILAPVVISVVYPYQSLGVFIMLIGMMIIFRVKRKKTFTA